MALPVDIHTLPDIADQAACVAPGAVALRDNYDGVFADWNYQQLASAMYRIARFLCERGVRYDDRVGLLLPNCRWWGAAFLGLLAGDAVAVPLDPRLQTPELAAIIASAGLSAIITSPLYARKVSEIQAGQAAVPTVLWLPTEQQADILPEQLASYPPEPLRRKKIRTDTALILYTSGTTGTPKGVVLTHANVLSNAYDLTSRLEVDSEEHFVSLLPLNHIFEITGGFVAPLSLRAPVTYTRSLRPDVILQTISLSTTTVMMVVPVFLRLFLHKIITESRKNIGVSFDILFAVSRLAQACRIPVGAFLFRSLKQKISPRFRAFVCGGAPLERAVIRDYAALGFTVLQGYGLTETSPVICVNTFRFNRPGTVGTVLPSLEIRIVDHTGRSAREGELWVRGNSVFKEYYRDPAATAAVFHKHWFRTGDIARRDRAGYVSICGRAKDTIITDGGKNIYPDEIEAVLLRGPLIADACVVGMPGPHGGERPVAVIMTTADYRPDSPDDLYRQVHSLLYSIAQYKRPRRVYVWDELPKTATLKTKRSDVIVQLHRDSQHGLIHR